MEKVILRDLYKNSKNYADKNVCIEGWVRTIRDSKTFSRIGYIRDLTWILDLFMYI